jgi:hypothetical protein
MTRETGDRRINTDARTADDGAKRLPHERDESPEGQDQQPRGIMKQAADDLAQGLVDTDLHGERGIETVVNGKTGASARPHEDAGDGMRHNDSGARPRSK